MKTIDLDKLTSEFCKLPSPQERCPYTGASRSWLLDQEKLGNIKIVRVMQPGRKRGACFLHVPSLLEFLRKQMEAQCPNDPSSPTPP